MALKLTPRSLLTTVVTGGANLLLEQLERTTGTPSPIRVIGDRLEAATEVAPTGLHLSGLKAAKSNSAIPVVGAMASIVGPFTVGGRPDVPRGPKGWLAFLVQHGQACQMYEFHYLTTHHHLNPTLAASWKYWGNHGGGDVDTDYSRGTLMCNRFCETQSPAFDFMAPVMWTERLGTKRGVWENAIRTAAGFDSGTTPQEVDSYAARRPYPHQDAYGRTRVGGNLGDYIERSYLTDLSPAQIVLNWYERTNGLEHATKGRIRTAAFDRLNSNMHRKFVIPAAYDVDHASREEWTQRMCAWLDTAQYLTWACEMARLHRTYGRATKCPSWWQKHCNAWGIAVPTAQTQADRLTYWERAVQQDDKAFEGLRLKLTEGEWQAVAWALMEAARSPGDKGYCGEQIVPDGHWRHILDMPGKCGALRPPPYLLDGQINQGLLGHWTAQQDFKSWWHSGFSKVWNTVFSAVASFTGAGVVLQALQYVQEAMAVIAQILQIGTALAHGGEVNWSAVEDIIGEVVDLTVNVAEANGVDLGQLMPDGVWDALTTAGAAIPAWGGSLAGAVKEKAEVLRADLLSLRDNAHWDYLDEGFSTLVTEP